MTLAAIPLGLAIGLAVGTLGGGGSVLAVPVLVYVLGQRLPEATTGSLAVVTAGALAGAIAHHQAGRVCWRHAGIFIAAGVPGVAAGTAAGDVVSPRLLIASFAPVMLAAGYATWRSANGSETPGEETPTEACPPLRIKRDVAAGLVLGFLTGFFGVGGGFLIVPTLAIALAFSMRSAVGTSLAVITAISLLGLTGHLLAGRTLDVGLIAVMTAGCAVGAAGGAAIASRLPQPALRRGFAVLVTAVAGYLVASATFLGGPPS
jgi:uncharacterized protein